MIGVSAAITGHALLNELQSICSGMPVMDGPLLDMNTVQIVKKSTRHAQIRLISLLSIG